MSKYAELDAAIVGCIKQSLKFTGISGRCTQLARAAAPDAEPWRTVDRRLQAMRKAGKIEFKSKTGWAIVAPKEQA